MPAHAADVDRTQLNGRLRTRQFARNSQRLTMRDGRTRWRRTRVAVVRHSWMAVALGAASLGGSAAAQTQYSVENPTPLPPERLGVLDRPRPGYDPIGLEWGPYYIFPRLDLSTTYDSNV